MASEFNTPELQREWLIAERNRALSQLERFLDIIRHEHGELLMEAYQAQRDFIQRRISSETLVSIGDAYDRVEAEQVLQLTRKSRVSPDRKEMLVQEYAEWTDTFASRNRALIRLCDNLSMGDVMNKWHQSTYEVITIIMAAKQVNYTEAKQLLRAWKKQDAAERKARKAERKAQRLALNQPPNGPQ